jgi:hypothetical protein
VSSAAPSGRVAARREKQLNEYTAHLLLSLNQLSLTGLESGAGAGAGAGGGLLGAFGKSAGAAAAATAPGTAPGTAPSTAPSTAPVLSYDDALKLAARAVISKREASRGKWAGILSVAKTRSSGGAVLSAGKAGGPKAGSSTGSTGSTAAAEPSEGTRLRKLERKLIQLDAEEAAVRRAIEQSAAARRRVEARLANELYFQQLLKQKMSEHGKPPVAPKPAAAPPFLGLKPKVGAAALPSSTPSTPSTASTAPVASASAQQPSHELLMMNELRTRSEAEALDLHRELEAVLKQREEEHTARLRSQLKGTVRRLISEALEEEGEAAIASARANQAAEERAKDAAAFDARAADYGSAPPSPTSRPSSRSHRFSSAGRKQAERRAEQRPPLKTPPLLSTAGQDDARELAGIAAELAGKLKEAKGMSQRLKLARIFDVLRQMLEEVRA